MKDPVEDCLDWLLAPNAIDLHLVAEIMHPHYPGYTLQELVALVAEQAVRDGFQRANASRATSAIWSLDTAASSVTTKDK